MMPSDPVALLDGLLRIYSPSDGEAEAAAYFVGWMAEAGFQAWVDAAGNAVGALGDGPADVVLLGHIDTVPGFIPVRRHGDRLYGRGAVDAKGPLAAFAGAVAQIGPLPDRRFVVIGAAGEEGDSRGAEHVADHYGPGGQLPEGRGAAPACLIIGEPSGWERITLGYKGSLWLDYVVQRPVAHTAGQGESACEAAVRFWNGVVSYADQYNSARGVERQFDQLTPTLRGLNSGTDGFTDSASLRIGLRLPPGLPVETLIDELQAIEPEGELQIFPGAMPAHRAEKNTSLVRAFLASIRSAGGSPGFTVKTGSSDMNVVAPRWGCPTLAYGPGDSALDHTAHEHILIPEYLAGVQVLTKVLSDPRLFATKQTSGS